MSFGPFCGAESGQKRAGGGLFGAPQVIGDVGFVNFTARTSLGGLQSAGFLGEKYVFSVRVALLPRSGGTYSALLPGSSILPEEVFERRLARIQMNHRAVKRSEF